MCDPKGIEHIRSHGIHIAATHLQIDMPSAVVWMSPMETRHARKYRRHDHAITITYDHVLIFNFQQKTPASRDNSKRFTRRKSTISFHTFAKNSKKKKTLDHRPTEMDLDLYSYPRNTPDGE